MKLVRKRGLPIFIFVFLLMTFLITSVSAVDQTGTFDAGYEISYPKVNQIIRNSSYVFNFHVYNDTEGVYVTNVTAECIFQLYDSDGNNVLEVNPASFNTNDLEWSVDVHGDNFSELGLYDYVFQCQDLNLDQGGFVSIPFEVTTRKIEIPTAEAMIYILLTSSILLLFLLSIYFTVVIPYSNRINEKGMVIKITKAKYFKLALIMLDYILFVWLLNVLIGVSDNFVSLTMYYGFISFIFEILNNLALPFVVFMFIVMIFEVIKDASLYNNLKKLSRAMR